MNMGRRKGSILLVFAAFRKLRGSSLNMTDYRDRLIVQKMAYMLKLITKTIDYQFTWYVRGPYSPMLTREAFRFDGGSPAGGYEFDGSEEHAIETIRGLFDVGDEKLWELYASVLYMMNENGIRDKDRLVFTIHSLKPWFSEEQIGEAFTGISNAGIIGTK